MRTKRVLLYGIIALITITCNNKEDIKPIYEYKDSGVITGADMSLCPCCGGWFIEIDNTTYRFLKLPDNCNFNMANQTFPFDVKIDWENDPNACFGDEIIVMKIEKI